MLKSIQKYILDNWISMNIPGPKPDKLSSIQISMGQGKKYNKGRLIHLLFRNDESQPFIVAKFCRSKEYEYHLRHENRICRLLKEKYNINYPPRQICQAVIEEKLVNFEEYVEGVSMKISLDNLIASNYSRENLHKIVEHHFEYVSQVIDNFNDSSEKINRIQLETELNSLIENFKEYYIDDKEFIELIDKETHNIFDKIVPEEVFYRIVNFDFVPQNIICNDEVKIIDWEFSDFSTLIFLEPIRFLHYYIRELISLNILKESNIEKILIYLTRSDSEEWFTNLVHKFYSRANIYGFPLEKVLLLFLIFEANLQFKMTNYLDSTKKDYRNMIINFINNSSAVIDNIEFKSEYEKTIENLNIITEKDVHIKILEKSLHIQISELNNSLMIKESQISELNNSLMIKESQISELNNSLMIKESQISELNNSLMIKESQISELNNSLITKDSQISELNNSLITKDSQIKTLEDSLQEKDLYIKELDDELHAIQQSIVWRSVMLFHIKIIEKLLSHGTNRRKLYDIALKSGRIIINEGFGGLWWHYNERKRVKKSQGELKKNIKEIQKLYIPSENYKKKITFPNTPENPDVSIIIPVHNNYKYTFNCLDSIVKNTQGSFEAIVVDDASSDETPSLLNKVENIKIIRNNENQGFIESCNIGVKSSKGKYLFFLNNDTIVTENWWEPLKSLISKDNVGAVGTKLVYPDGKLQEAGAIIWNDASGWNYGRYNDPNGPEYNFVREVDYCSGAALLVKKELFEKLGGFDERFKPGYYEDTDLCFSIRKLGYKVLYQPQSTIIHFEGITGGTDINTGAKKYQDINKSKFYTKWKDVLEKEHHKPEAVNLLFYARDKRKGKNILIIDHYVPTFDKDSGSYRMYNILKILSELGHKVTFIGDNLMPFEPYTDILQQHGIEVIYAPYIKSINDYLAENGKFFDIVILSRSHIAINHISSVKRYCNKAKIILDTVDLQYLREMRRATIENNENVLKEAQVLKEMEFKLAKECDITLVVSPVEKDIMLKEDPSLKVEILSNIHEIYPPEKAFSERKDIMFLGGFAHLPNIDAVKYFVKDILPIIKKEIPDIKFYIVGSNPPREIEKLNSDDITVTGYIEDLVPYFENCRIMIAPLRYGAGIKGKIGEAMAHGLPVVTTSIGAEGMNLEKEENVLVSDNIDEFARHILTLYKDETLWYKISKNSIEYIRKTVSYDISKNVLEELIYNNVNREKHDYR